MSGGGKGGKGAPAPPDYTGVANQQAQQSQQNVNNQTAANRPDITTPWGSQTWEQGEATLDQAAYDSARNQAWEEYTGQLENMGAGGVDMSGFQDEFNQRWDLENRSQYETPGGWSMQTTLTPESQAALEAQQRIQAGRSGLAESLLGRAGQEMSSGIDWNGLPEVGNGMEARQRAEDAIYSRASSRLDPMWNQRQGQLESQLANQGLTPGSEAYSAAMRDMNFGRNDAYQTALNESIMGGGQEMSRQYGQDLSARQQGISEGHQKQYGTMNALSALLAGQQVGMPQMPGFAQSGQAQTPDLLGAAAAGYQGQLNQYGAQQAQQQGLFNGFAALPFMF
jgi:hypothetical protein